MSDLENNIMDKKFSFSVKDIKWVISTLVVVIGWIITIVFWVQDKNKQKARIEVLESKNGTLEIQVAKLEGQISGVNLATENFMKNPPSETKFRVELLEKRVDKIEQLNNISKFTEISTNKPIRRDR
jgi:hypothetical protein